MVGGTPAQPFLDEHNGRMFDSIRSVTSSAVGSLEYIAQRSEPSRSAMGARPSAGTAAGVLFIPYQAGQIAALRSTISAWMRLAIFEAMDRERGDQRLWFVVDELDALGQIEGSRTLWRACANSAAAACWAFSRSRKCPRTYGSGDAQTIVENCGNTLILRCSASEDGGTSRFASRLIGEREVIRTAISRSRRPTDLWPAVTKAEHLPHRGCGYGLARSSSCRT